METRADRRARRRRELSLLLYGDRTEYGHRRKTQKSKARPAALRDIHRYGSAAIHLWSASLAWFTAYPGPRVGAETAVTAVTAYQEDMLLAILPMYIYPDGTGFRDPFCDAADRLDPLSPPHAHFSSGHMDVRYEPKQHKHRHRDPARCGSNL